MKKFGVLFLVTFFSLIVCLSINAAQPRLEPTLWQVYQQSLSKAKYVDLTHTITPSIPVWSGFGPSKFEPTINPKTGQPYNYQKDGFEATHYDLSTDQLGTQLDPPAHWNPDYPALDELPATFAVRPLVVIPISEQVARDPNYHLTVKDIFCFNLPA
ncbi:cyclase family protein [Floridanema evergladense]|uniref:Cyclase family protein n=1 Tax=Floridaenema evergladense BLCC-F167 TaxID=3153639 RepID=A0ABV4WXC3_9CYAN